MNDGWRSSNAAPCIAQNAKMPLLPGWAQLLLLVSARSAGGSLTDADVEHIDIYAGGYRSHSTAGGGH
jgi:hypothetical protein